MAAPSRARTVKDLIFAPLTVEELDSLATITDKVLAGLALSRNP